jgi:hypothetical protein
MHRISDEIDGSEHARIYAVDGLSGAGSVGTWAVFVVRARPI